jgi:hypothetical protein
MKFYFAFDLNMDSERMCSSHCEAHYVGHGRLNDYKWIIQSNGVAAIIPSAGDYVLGIVYEIPEEEELPFESGFHNSKLEHEWKLLRVDLEEQPLNCWTFLVINPEEGKPWGGYIHAIKLAVRSRNLPSEYVDLNLRPHFTQRRNERDVNPCFLDLYDKLRRKGGVFMVEEYRKMRALFEKGLLTEDYSS